MALKILVSAGEASGDLYASELVAALRAMGGTLGGAEFFGCTGPRLREAGVRTVVDAQSLAVVGLAEVLTHLPRIWGDFRKLVRAAEDERPALAILADSPDFHLRVAARLKKLGVPVLYLVAPQVWAWREWRVRRFPALMDHLVCLFPFEQDWFRQRGVTATYVGHPLARLVKPAMGREELLRRLGPKLGPETRLVALLPGSRRGEIARHLPALLETAGKLRAAEPGLAFCLAMTTGGRALIPRNFWEPISAASIQIVEGATWDVLAQSEVALAASGTVTMEAAMLGTPMVTFYRVNALSWLLGRRLVRVPYLTMVNLVAGRRVVEEYMQDAMTAGNLAAAALRLLRDPAARDKMRRDLGVVRESLEPPMDPMAKAAEIAAEMLGRAAAAR